MGAAMLPFSLVIGSVMLAIFVTPGLLLTVFHALGLGAALTTLAWNANPWPSLKPRELKADDEHFYLDGQAHSRAAVKSAYVIAGDNGWLVRIHSRGFRLPVDLVVDSEQTGEQVLHKLGLSASQTVATFTGYSRTHESFLRGFFTVFGTLFVGVILSLLISPIIVPPFMLIAMLVLLLAPSNVDVGADGVLVRWLGTKRFIPHHDIISVETEIHTFPRRDNQNVVLHLRNGRFNIPMGSARMHGPRAAGMTQRIRHAKAVHDSGDAVPTEAQLNRGDASYTDWALFLREAMTVATHRAAPLRHDKLWRIVENAAAEPLGRAAAAVALSSSLNSGDRDKLKRIASATAEPKLRIAFEAACEQTEETRAIADALAALESSGQKRRQAH